MCVCVCVRACVRACVCACVRVCRLLTMCVVLLWFTVGADSPHAADLLTLAVAREVKVSDMEDDQLGDEDVIFWDNKSAPFLPPTLYCMLSVAAWDHGPCGPLVSVSPDPYLVIQGRGGEREGEAGAVGGL